MKNQIFLPKVSCIIINNDNQDKSDTIQSVICQSYTNLECILVNNSVSKSEVIKPDVNIPFTLLEVNSIEEDVLINSGVSIASGDFVIILTNNRVFCNSDVISQLLSDEFESIDIIYGNMVKVYPNQLTLNSFFQKNIILEDILFDYLDLFPVTLFKRNLFYEYSFHQEGLKFTSKMLFEIKLFVFNKLNIKHKDLFIVNQKVNKIGQTSRYSDAHLIAKERDMLLENYLSFSLKTLLYGKIEAENYINNSRTMVAVRKLESIKKIVFNVINPIIYNINYSLSSMVSSRSLNSYKKKYLADSYNIPIIINNRNHISYLKRLIASLEVRGYTNIFIIDNNSNYRPLKDYYAVTPYKVYHLNGNVGFCALWDTEIYDLFEKNYYVYTDSDVELIDECPNDFLVVMQYYLTKYKVGKVGLSLLTNDLPNHYEKKEEVIAWEKQFQRDKVENLIYKAKVDTTFALYGPGKFGHASMLTSLRIDFPYSARHLPWYEITNQLTEEQIYYYTNAKTSSHWSSKVELNNESGA